MFTIHTVQPGDTVYSIAEKYNVPYTRIEEDNNLPPNYNLNVGQAIMVVTPQQVYTVKEGDTLEGIASAFGVPIIQLLRNNPKLSDRDYLYVGEDLVISYDNKNKSIEIIGYATTYISDEVLRKTLPFLTYIAVLNYTFTAFGDIEKLNDEEIIKIAKSFHVEPIMFLSSITVAGKGGYGITHSILLNEQYQEALISNALTIMKDKGYYGLNLSLYGILPDDLQAYTNFIAKATVRLHREGFKVFVTLAPYTFGFKAGVPYYNTYYSDIGKIADYIILITYTWATATLSQVLETTVDFLDKYISFASKQIPPEKIFIGLSRVAYNWELPYVEGESLNTSLTNAAALDLANELGIEIQFDEATQTPFFTYTDYGVDHFVWFKDTRTVNAILHLVDRYNLRGIAVWNILYFLSQTWLPINSQYNIKTISQNSGEGTQS
ncbi:MAG TPA: LysM peptidoglycan-binding domain-containing protein [Mobilitalea sp.]|nr:LysM peptidoglycan-binding domain-containing protein [Mobilitalea sp.]